MEVASQAMRERTAGQNTDSVLQRATGITFGFPAFVEVTFGCLRISLHFSDLSKVILRSNHKGLLIEILPSFPTETNEPAGWFGLD